MEDYEKNPTPTSAMIYKNAYVAYDNKLAKITSQSYNCKNAPCPNCGEILSDSLNHCLWFKQQVNGGNTYQLGKMYCNKN